MKNKKAQLNFEEIIRIAGAIIALIFIIPIITIVLNSISGGSLESSIDSLVNLFIPLFILAVIIEFIRRFIR